LLFLFLRPWDFEKFLNLQCYYSNILYPFWASRWIDVRQMFSDWLGLRKCNIEKMLYYFGFIFEGKQHCGLDDARNIARILMKLVEIGSPISFNGHIRKCRSVIEKYPYSTQFNGFIDS
jgi:3'-5' exoribonuclease 1